MSNGTYVSKDWRADSIIASACEEITFSSSEYTGSSVVRRLVDYLVSTNQATLEFSANTDTYKLIFYRELCGKDKT